MKILHVISSLGVCNGGPSLTDYLTVKGLNNAGVNTSILTYKEQSGDHPIGFGDYIYYLPPLEKRNLLFAYSTKLFKYLKNNSTVDIYHIQGLWQYTNYATARIANGFSKPYLITTHGMLYPQSFKSSGWKKKIALILYQRRILEGAACIHATCVEEMQHYRALGFTNPVAVVHYPFESQQTSTPFFDDGIRRIGYLGRIHPRKNVEKLLECWNILNEPGELLIMGSGEEDYMKYLKNETIRLGLKKVRFMGLVTGETKKRLLASLTCLVVPSDFENCGMVIPEALDQMVPVIASKGTPWEELNIYQCGFWTSNDIKSLSDAIRKVLSMSDEELSQMGYRGKELIKSDYSIDKISQDMKILYEWILYGGEKPEFVYLK